jgi:hypothetical protein
MLFDGREGDKVSFERSNLLTANWRKTTLKHGYIAAQTPE